MDEKEFIDRLKEIFVTRKECDEKNDAIHTLMNDISLRLAKIEEHITIQSWLTKAVLGGMITLIIGAIGALIFKG